MQRIHGLDALNGKKKTNVLNSKSNQDANPEGRCLLFVKTKERKCRRLEGAQPLLSSMFRLLQTI